MDLSDEEIAHYRTRIHELASSVAAQYGAFARQDDLEQEGFIGFWQALPHFDPSQRVTLWTFAGYRARGAMIDFLRVGLWSRDLRRSHDRLTATRQAFQSEHGRPATWEELAALLDTSVQNIRRWDRKWEDLQRLVAPQPEPWRDDRILDRLEHRETWGIVATAMRTLPGQSRRLLRRYYADGWTQAMIAQELHISPARVSQVHAEAIAQLRSVVLA